MKFGQLIEHPKKNIFLKKLCRKWVKETSSRPLFVFKRSFILGKSKSSAAWFHYISIALKLACNKNNLFKTLHNWSKDMLNFDFLDQDLGIDLAPHFVYDFSTRMSLMLHSISWPNFIAWFPLLFEILGNMCIAIVCYPGCEVMDFEINFIFLIEPFFVHDQKAMTKTNILRTKRAFKVKLKAFWKSFKWSKALKHF